LPESRRSARTKLVNLCESFSKPSRLDVDRQTITIRDVELCGPASLNGRIYPLAVLREATRLYDGRAVFVGHSEDLRAPRSLWHQVGTVENTRFQGGVVRGDLRLNAAHAETPRLLRLARQGKLGLSHNAEVQTRERDGLTTVTRIVRVKSVDLVANPATTSPINIRRPIM
jgi:hypothetical protein